MLRASLGFLTLAVIVTISVFGLDSSGRHLSAADGFAGPCNGQLTITFNDDDHPDLWPKSSLDITIEGDTFQLEGPSPIIPVVGTINAMGAIEAFGEGTYADYMVVVTFQGNLTGTDPKQPDLLEGEYSVGSSGGLPGGLPINYGLDCPIKPPPKTYTITVLKQDADTKADLPGWKMNLYAGSDCGGDPIDSATTNAEGLADFVGLAAGSYSVEEKMQADWNNITRLCQDTSVPTTAGASVAGDPTACPIQPDEPFPAPGCDEFNSVASVNIEFFNPPGAQLHCALGGPTQITRSAVSGTPDNIQTEITILDLTGTCDPGGIAVTVRLNPDIPSTGKITEQQNNESGVLEFKANSYFDIYFEVDTPLGKLHNQEALRLECKIQDIPPYGCFYEPDVGTVTLYNAEKKEVATLTHAAHIPLDPKQKLLIFINEQKPPTTPTPGDVTPTPTPTATPTINPSFEEKIDVCIDAQVIATLGAAPIWTKAQIDTLVRGADGIWSPANINITWNNNITDIDDPNSPPDGPGQHGDIIDTFKSDAEFNSLGNNANTAGKEKCVRIFFIRNFIDNDGTQYETSDGDATLAEADGKGRGHYIVVSLKAKDNSQTFAHEFGHIFGLQHNDPDKDNNLMNSFKEPDATQLNKEQMQTAREGAAAISAQDPGDVTPTVTPTKTPQPQRTRYVTLRCVRGPLDQKVTGSVTVTEKKVDQPDRVVLEVSCDSNTNPVVRTSYSISASATKNLLLDVQVGTRNNSCPFPGFTATQRVSVSCTASPEGLEFVETESEGGDGDANKNGTVDSIDAALILQFIAGLTDGWPNSDANGDGTTNAIDVALILQFTAGFLNGLPT